MFSATTPPSAAAGMPGMGLHGGALSPAGSFNGASPFGGNAVFPPTPQMPRCPLCSQTVPSQAALYCHLSESVNHDRRQLANFITKTLHDRSPGPGRPYKPRKPRVSKKEKPAVPMSSMMESVRQRQEQEFWRQMVQDLVQRSGVSPDTSIIPKNMREWIEKIPKLVRHLQYRQTPPRPGYHFTTSMVTTPKGLTIPVRDEVPIPPDGENRSTEEDSPPSSAAATPPVTPTTKLTPALQAELQMKLKQEQQAKLQERQQQQQHEMLQMQIRHHQQQQMEQQQMYQAQQQQLAAARQQQLLYQQMQQQQQQAQQMQMIQQQQQQAQFQYQGQQQQQEGESAAQQQASVENCILVQTNQIEGGFTTLSTQDLPQYAHAQYMANTNPQQQQLQLLQQHQEQNMPSHPGQQQEQQIMYVMPDTSYTVLGAAQAHPHPQQQADDQQAASGEIGAQELAAASVIVPGMGGDAEEILPNTTDEQEMMMVQKENGAKNE